MKMKKSVIKDPDGKEPSIHDCFLKIKYKNKVKKVSALPDKFGKLNNIIKSKYDEFKEGKKTYTLCYVDDEDELVNISDEEDYSVFKDFVDEKHLSNAKVYLSRIE